VRYLQPPWSVDTGITIHRIIRNHINTRMYSDTAEGTCNNLSQEPRYLCASEYGTDSDLTTSRSRIHLIKIMSLLVTRMGSTKLHNYPLFLREWSPRTCNWPTYLGHIPGQPVPGPEHPTREIRVCWDSGSKYYLTRNA